MDAKEMSAAQSAVLTRLEEMGVPFEIDRHEAVYTIEAMVELGLDKRGDIVKNLFLRDAKGKRHFLVVLPGDKQADLKAIRAQLGCTALSFGSEDRLDRCLKLSKGAVSPLGVLNDSDHAVEVVLDKDLIGKKSLGVHPNDNTATLWLTYDDLKKVIDACGNKVHFIKL
ncbi:MAG: prolyl-tRNA synthetase associated domain-containing protein [Fretibacterium sp.]|nr:prolyl-tRNA synthetase associated domain-containing protein [Fretibacterium sp.]